MLETKELCKTYKPKKGVPVKAVDHVSLRFAEKGMVFLLGKSGSGKSTMLNLLGGLDKYDSGEIIIKGVSSKNFSQQCSDSYRNTYVGFIFQEYNVLEEFTVGANIALALELQGKKAADNEINKILHDVDLDGYGNRNPNELSGGQKQRVAIARALVKNPEIIMADEPTGALDSNTGRQVLDTLKKLSQTKLVIVVSHDREYAEKYADRIIELADGKIIRDVQASQNEDTTDDQLFFHDNTIELPCGYHLSDEDRLRINEYVDKLKSDVKLIVSPSDKRFTQTDQSQIVSEGSSEFAPIRSKLPLHAASKIGRSSLHHKKVRLVFTILLSVVAFTLFAFVDTFGSYNHIRSCVDSLIDSDINYISVGKSVKEYSGGGEWWRTDGALSEKDIQDIISQTGIRVAGIYSPGSSPSSMMFSTQFDPSKIIPESKDLTQNMYIVNLMKFCGFAEITESDIKNMGYSIYSGRIPDGSKNEIAISLMACNTFIKGGYSETTKSFDEMSLEPDVIESYLSGAVSYDKISSPEEMIGKTLFLNDTLYTITGIIDTKHDTSRYERLVQSHEGKTTADNILDFILWMEYENNVAHSLTGAAMVGKGKIPQLISERPKIYSNESSQIFVETDNQSGIRFYLNNFSKLSDIPENEIIWFDEKKTSLADNEIILAFDDIGGMASGDNTNSDASAEFTEKFIEKNKKLISSFTGIHADISFNSESDGYTNETIDNIKIVGCIKKNSVYSQNSASVFSDNIFNKVISNSNEIYQSAVGCMPKSRSEIEDFVKYCYRDGEDISVRYELNNAVTYQLGIIDSTIKALSRIFLYIGFFFALFASLLMANFISTSISYKRQEIGILRAIGSRSNDVFRIFFSESFIIAIINFIISSVLCCTGTIIINTVIRSSLSVYITILHFGPRQLLLLLAISIAVAFLASFIPVQRIASKKPIDAIRGR